VGGGPTEIIWRNPVGLKARICQRFQGDFGDQRIAVARREGVDNALLSEVATLAIAVKDGVGEVGIELGERISNEDDVGR